MAMVQNILLIQSDYRAAKAVREALTNSRDRKFKVETVRSCTLGCERLLALGKQHSQAPEGISAVLMDLRLPDVSGIEAFRRIWAAAPQVPILILSSAQDESIAVTAVKSGAQDYLLKHRLDDYLLPKAIAGVIDRAAISEALFHEKERAQVTLNSIGDAVISTDTSGRVTYLNVVAERLTGFAALDAMDRPLEEVLKVIDAETRASVAAMAAAPPADDAGRKEPTHVLIRRDGSETPIEDSAAPIHDRRGEVTGTVMVFRDVTSARALSQKLSHLAQHDSLTDLPNRTVLSDRLSQAIIGARRYATALAILYLDLDRFKHINDSLGHAVGDRLLQSVAARLTDCVRKCDTVCRLGGDEFVIVLADVADARDAAVCAEKILKVIAMPHLIDEHELHVTASIGVVVCPEDGTEVEGLLQSADSAMYEAKETGRSNYQFSRIELNSKAVERQATESALRHAIARHEFELFYQPHIDLISRQITGAEALIRWRHPVLGMVLPTQFISIAEESGLIVPIGQWVLREACRQAREWQDAGLPTFRLGVNISSVELRSKDVVAGIAQVLSSTALDPRRLELELTETFLMHDAHSTRVVLDDIKSLGIQLALDDFGTGYSSLSYVRKFPIDALKVDRSFVRDLSTDESDACVVRAVINMGRSLRMRVVAEGVETLDQVNFLEAHGCSEAQGYFFGRPIPASAFADLLRSGCEPSLALPPVRAIRSG